MTTARLSPCLGGANGSASRRGCRGARSPPSGAADDEGERPRARPTALDRRPQPRLAADDEVDLLASADAARGGEQAASAVAQQQVELGATGGAQANAEDAVEWGPKALHGHRPDPLADRAGQLETGPVAPRVQRVGAERAERFPARLERIAPGPPDGRPAKPVEGECLRKGLARVLEVVLALVAGEVGPAPDPLADALVGRPSLRAPIERRAERRVPAVGRPGGARPLRG